MSIPIGITKKDYNKISRLLQKETEIHCLDSAVHIRTLLVASHLVLKGKAVAKIIGPDYSFYSVLSSRGWKKVQVIDGLKQYRKDAQTIIVSEETKEWEYFENQSVVDTMPHPHGTGIGTLVDLLEGLSSQRLKIVRGVARDVANGHIIFFATAHRRRRRGESNADV